MKKQSRINLKKTKYALKMLRLLDVEADTHLSWTTATPTVKIVAEMLYGAAAARRKVRAEVTRPPLEARCPIDAEHPITLYDLAGAILLAAVGHGVAERVAAAGGAQDRSAQGQDARNRRGIEQARRMGMGTGSQPGRHRRPSRQPVGPRSCPGRAPARGARRAARALPRLAWDTDLQRRAALLPLQRRRSEENRNDGQLAGTKLGVGYRSELG